MKTRRRTLLASALCLPALCARAATQVVAPGQSLDQALRRAADGDEIHLLAGLHRAQTGVIEQKRLTLRGVGGRAVLEAVGAHAEGKALLVVRGGDVRVEDIEFRGARVPDGNGAGIRFERGRLLVNRCRFIDNEMGLLTGNIGDAELTVQDCEFGEAPRHSAALPHLLYAGSIARLTVTGSRFSGGRRGHLLKSRAREHHIRYNHLVDGEGGSASYELEFPNGGLADVVGNVIGQSEDTDNRVMLAFGAEGSDDRPHALLATNNTFINFGSQTGIFIRVHDGKLRGAVEQHWVNNLCLGPGEPDAMLADSTRGNFVAALAVLQDAQGGRYALRRDSGLRGRGIAPGMARGIDLRPTFEYTASTGTRPLPAPAHWSPGAYQE